MASSCPIASKLPRSGGVSATKRTVNQMPIAPIGTLTKKAAPADAFDQCAAGNRSGRQCDAAGGSPQSDGAHERADRRRRQHSAVPASTE
jgi:hypothetical protein